MENNLLCRYHIRQRFILSYISNIMQTIWYVSILPRRLRTLCPLLGNWIVWKESFLHFTHELDMRSYNTALDIWAFLITEIDDRLHIVYKYITTQKELSGLRNIISYYSFSSTGSKILEDCYQSPEFKSLRSEILSSWYFNIFSIVFLFLS